jgi:hypothetical protein
MGKKAVNTTKSKLRILSCYCESSFQDGLYGNKKRVCNATGREYVYCCTVCGKDVNV